MLRMSNIELLPNFGKVDDGICEPCILGKMNKRLCKKHWHTKEFLEVIHSNGCGSMRVKTHRRMQYFVTFVDDF